jgi:colanic acid biosynthesis glycosyl transferase WcaI
MVVSLARRLERAAYRTADRIVVLSRSFTSNLLSKNVEEEKIELIYDPATRVPQNSSHRLDDDGSLRILSMGNIGYSQGLAPVIEKFEAFPELTERASLRVTGTGVAAEEARAGIRSDRVQMLGLVDDGRLEQELSEADVGLVTQHYEGPEFNIPSKLMNFMAYGLPVLAAVDPAGEVARIIKEANAGWVVNSRDLDALPREIARIGREQEELSERSANARRYAALHFTPDGFASRFEEVLLAVAER